MAAELAPGLYRIVTTEHEAGEMPEGWGLSAWHAHGAVRNDIASWAAVHEGDHWPMTWAIVPGKTEGTYRILTTGHADGKMPAGWGLSAWHAHGAKRNDCSSWVAVHKGDHWPMDWEFHPVGEDTYRIVTTEHEDGKMPAGWGLSAWHAHGAVRNDVSSWVAVHEGDDWPMVWRVELVQEFGAPGAEIEPGVYRIVTTEHEAGEMPEGWGLSAWHAHGAVRNGASSWAAVHEGDRWPMDWAIVPGMKPGTYRILTTGHADGKMPAGWGLSAWHAHGAERNDVSSWVAVHKGDHWPMDWEFQPADEEGTYRILTTEHAAGEMPAGWGLSAWHAHGAVRNKASSWAAVHEGDHWPMVWRLERVGDLEKDEDDDETEEEEEEEPDEARSLLVMQAKTVRVGRNGDAVESIRAHVDFDAAFPDTPVVVCCAQAQAGTDYADCFGTCVVNASPEGFDVNVGRQHPEHLTWGQYVDVNVLAVYARGSDAVQAGVLECGPKDESDESMVVKIKFKPKFTKKPAVICTALGEDWPDCFAVSLRKVTKQSAEVVIARTRPDCTGWGQSLNLNWIATTTLPSQMVDVGPHDGEEDALVTPLKYERALDKPPITFAMAQHEKGSKYPDVLATTVAAVSEEGFQLNMSRVHTSEMAWGQDMRCHVVYVRR